MKERLAEGDEDGWSYIWGQGEGQPGQKIRASKGWLSGRQGGAGAGSLQRILRTD